MKYPDGQEVRLGDKVKLWDGCYGMVVCSIDSNEYSSDYPKDDWAYLREGVLVSSDKGGLIHYIEPDEDFELAERNSV